MCSNNHVIIVDIWEFMCNSGKIINCSDWFWEWNLNEILQLELSGGKPSYGVTKGVFRTLPDIVDGAFLQKQLIAKAYFQKLPKKAPS